LKSTGPLIHDPTINQQSAVNMSMNPTSEFLNLQPESVS
jgi:hypothetical protein